eukprot:gene7676-5381_t
MARNLLNFNVHEGCLEAVVRGYQDGLLRAEEYNNLCQCDNLNDLKSQLQVTDYGNFLQQEGELSAQVIVHRAREVLVKQLQEIRTWSEPLLAQFLDFIRYEYMISNVLKLIVAKKSGRSHSLDLLTRCHPLGLFPQLPTLLAATDIKEMFEVVLLDSPVGRFFSVESGAGGFERDLDGQSVEYIRALLLRNYYEQFYDFCFDVVGGETRDVMCPLLEAEADRLCLTYTLNTCDLLDVRAEDRLKVFPRIGSLVDIHDEIADSDSAETLRERLRRFPTYEKLLEEGHGMDMMQQNTGSTTTTSSLERRFTDLAVQMYGDALTRQFQFGVFYAYVKLKELEIQNLQWISDCIVQQMRNRLQEYINIM